METRYTPQSPIRQPLQLARGMFRDLISSRGLAWRLFLRDLSAQYRQSALGYAWAFAAPLLSALPWVYLSSQRILNAGETAIPYPAYVLAGTTLWSAFADSLLVPLNALVAGRPMLGKINFPREALVIGGLGQLAVNLTIRVGVMLGILALLGVPVLGQGLLAAPLGLAAIVMAGLSLGLLLAPIGMLYTDVSRGLTLATGLWMIFTPVVYVPATTGLAGWLARWNPASPLIATARDWFTGQSPTQLEGFLVVTAASLIVLLVGWVQLRLTLPIIVERIGG